MGLAVILLASSGCIGNSNELRATAPAGIDPGTAGSTPSAGFSGLDGAEPEGPAVTLHRLNNVEYDNTVRDLLGTKLSFLNAFSGDESANGFDNNAAALNLTTSRMYDYVIAAEALATELTRDKAAMDRLAPCPSGSRAADCVEKFVESFGARAWRRPLIPQESAAVVAVATGTSSDTYAQSLQKAVVSLLVSPYFLYRVEGKDGELLTPYELATKLSYFLWVTTPDAELTAAAADGSLTNDAVLFQQVERMLADDKAKAMRANFLDQWLSLRRLQVFSPDATFKAWSEDLRASMVAQTYASFDQILAGQKPLHALFDGNTVFVDNRLAAFYGMASPNSTDVVEVAASARRGVLTQGAVLAATSNSYGTSLVRRGLFVSENFLCSSTGAAPANVPPLPSAATKAKRTQREILEEHVSSPSCAACHASFDPYGYVLEPFDAIGAARTMDNGGVIDPTATLVDGTKVQGVDALSDMLGADGRVTSCFIQKFITYALGRTLNSGDATALSQLRDKFVDDDQRVNHLLQAVVFSDLFRHRPKGGS